MGVISKEVFVKAVDDIRKMWKYQDDLNTFLNANGADGYIFLPDCTDTVIKVLHEIWGAADSEDLISYFIFDLEFGADWAPGAINDWYGNDLKLQTTEDLYNALNQIWEEQEKAVTEARAGSK